LKAIQILKDDIKAYGEGQNEQRTELLAISFYNLGCQHEFLNENISALKSYETALSMEKSKQKNGNEKYLLNEFKKCVKLIKDKIVKEHIERNQDVSKRESTIFIMSNKANEKSQKRQHAPRMALQSPLYKSG